MSQITKKKLDQIKSSLFSRTMSLAKLSLNAGAGIAGQSLSGLFQTQEKKTENWNAFLSAQAQIFTKEVGELKGSIMKAGQMLSMYGEYFFPPEVNQFLKSLQQDSPALKWEAIDFSLKQLKITGKGNKQRLMPCSEKLLHLLEEHKATQNQRFEIKKDKNYIFLTNNGQQLYPNYVYRLIKEKFRNVVAEKKSPHVLRHSFATHISNNGAKLSDIKELMGHASLASTQVYTHNTIEQLKEVYKKAHPKA